jgi:hypothetical protein
MKYTIFTSKIEHLNGFFLCLYYKENKAYRPYFIVLFTQNGKAHLFIPIASAIIFVKFQ